MKRPGAPIDSPSSVVTSPNTTVELLRRVAVECPDRAAYVSADRTLTYGSWDESADALAYTWQRIGVGKGDVVALVLPSCIEYPVCYQAAMRLGAVTTGVNPRLGRWEIDAILARTRARVAVVADGLPAPESAETVLRCSDVIATWNGRRAIDFPRIASTDPVAIVWTSGTTGGPKGAVFTHRQLCAVASSSTALTARFDRKLSPTPFTHIGYMVHAWEEIQNAVTIVIPPTPWKAGRVLELMERTRVTVGQGVAAHWRLMFDCPDFATTDLSALRIAGTGGSIIPPELVAEMRERLRCPVVVGYSSTEAGVVSETSAEGSIEEACSTVGKARPNVELRVVDAGGVPLEPDEPGWVQCRSAAVMEGYLDDPEATSRVLDGDDWLSVGDMGRLDSDGTLTLLGRGGEMFIRGGYNVYPAEVERVLARHPAVALVAVVGQPDPVLGEIGRAFVVPERGGVAPDLDELRSWCSDDLADYKAPDRLELVDELPHTRLEKIDRAALAARSCAAAETRL